MTVVINARGWKRKARVVASAAASTSSSSSVSSPPSSSSHLVAVAVAAAATSLVITLSTTFPALADAAAAAATAAAANETASLASVVEDDAPALFAKSCAGCHAGGGNVVSPGNTLSEADLSRNGLLSSEKLFDVIYSGRGKMPGYGEKCAPKGACTFAARLSDEEVGALGEFVLKRAAEGWK